MTRLLFAVLLISPILSAAVDACDEGRHATRVGASGHSPAQQRRGVGHARVRPAAYEQRWHAERCGSALPRHLRQPEENRSQGGRLLRGLADRPRRRTGPTGASGRLDPPKSPGGGGQETDRPKPLGGSGGGRHNSRRRARLTPPPATRRARPPNARRLPNRPSRAAARRVRAPLTISGEMRSYNLPPVLMAGTSLRDC